MAFAETVVLKSGQTIECEIVKKTDKYIEVDFQGVTLTYFLDEVERIEGGKKAVPAPSEDTLGKHKSDAVEKNILTETPKAVPDIISQVNAAYYNLKQQGLQELKCEVTGTVFDQIKETYKLKYPATDPRNNILNSIKFYLVFDKNSGLNVRITPYTPTEDADFNKVVQEATGTIYGQTTFFSEIWGSFIIERIFEKKDLNYTIDKLSNGYNISYEGKKPGEVIKISLDSNFRISQESLLINNETIKITPYFISSGQGLLIQGYEYDFNNGNGKNSATIDYQEAEGLQLPKQVAIQITDSGVTSEIKLSFINFEIKKNL
jgi:hypothetical protein